MMRFVLRGILIPFAFGGFVALAGLFLAGVARGADAPAACVTVHAPPNWSGSGVCVKSEKGKSWVVSCNHVFSDTPHPQGSFRDDIYPVKCSVSAGGKKYPAVAVAGSRTSDLVLVAVDAELPAAALADSDAPADAKVTRFGNGTGFTQTTVSGTKSRVAQASFAFRVLGKSESGDSGAAYFDAKGRVVGIHCGRDETFARGTPASAVREFLAKHTGKAGAAKVEAPKVEPKTPPALPAPRILIGGLPYERGPDGVYRPCSGGR